MTLDALVWSQLKGSRWVLESDGTFNSDCKRFLLEGSKMDEPGFSFDFRVTGLPRKVRARLQKETYECDRTEKLQKKNRAENSQLLCDKLREAVRVKRSAIDLLPQCI